jgi:SAM-dependent methyltransferase
MIGPSATVALFVLPVMWTLIGLGVWLSPNAGYVALAAWQLQPLLALLGTKLHARDLPFVTLFRMPIEVYIWVRTIAGKRAINDAAAARRPDYAERMKTAPAALLEPRRETCPVCDGKDLYVKVRNPDLLQHKPGTFTLEACRGCGHIFQNPRLSIAGLDFYYKDFYDGLGEAGMEFVFGFSAQPYRTRADMVIASGAPKRWLDVGCGHGHFCQAARGRLPDTQFDGLDLSESIDEAKRRGWVDVAYRGMFPDLAPGFAGAYDAVSMSHYLEHTLDQRAELDAAVTALAPGGRLLIEVPDPEYGLAKLLRGYWLPWFQPQHIHLISVGNLEKLMRERGLEPLEWHRGKAHQKVDFFFAAWLFLDHIAPAPHLPWRPRGIVGSTWRVVAWTIGAPLILGGIFIDNLIGPLIARGKRGNTYRVVARKKSD